MREKSEIRTGDAKFQDSLVADAANSGMASRLDRAAGNEIFFSGVPSAATCEPCVDSIKGNAAVCSPL